LIVRAFGDRSRAVRVLHHAERPIGTAHRRVVFAGRKKLAEFSLCGRAAGSEVREKRFLRIVRRARERRHEFDDHVVVANLTCNVAEPTHRRDHAVELSGRVLVLDQSKHGAQSPDADAELVNGLGVFAGDAVALERTNASEIRASESSRGSDGVLVLRRSGDRDEFATLQVKRHAERGFDAFVRARDDGRQRDLVVELERHA
jgi:hypothetical protein